MPLTTAELLPLLGPLAALAGTWEGKKGDDTAPADDRGVEKNYFRERIVFEPFGPVNNHEQTLYGLKYSKMAWRLDEVDSFHEETGYWLWDEQEQQAMRCLIVPRGIAVIAGGSVAPNAKEFKLSAELGSPTYGIVSNKFLDREFKTVRFDMKVTVHDANSFSYEEDTQMKMPKRPDLFHHIDKNTLHRV